MIVLCAGMIALDVVRTPLGVHHRTGGTAANVAAILAQLGWESAVAAVVGDDEAGRIAVAGLAAAGVETSHVLVEPGASTPVVVHHVGRRPPFDLGCDTCFRPWASPRSLPGSATAALMSPAPDAFVFDRASANGTLALAQAHAAAGALVVFEPSTKGHRQTSERANRTASIVKYSGQRASAVHAPVNLAADQVEVVTEGPRGTRFRMGSSGWAHVDGFVVDAVDSVGAGDWLTAGLVDALCRRSRPWPPADLEAAIRSAQALAAVSCLAPGARGLSDALGADEILAARASLLGGGSVGPLPPVSGASELPGRCPTCRLAVDTRGLSLPYRGTPFIGRRDDERSGFSVGYGGRDANGFRRLLREHEVEVVLDVRMHPDRASMGYFARTGKATTGIAGLLAGAGVAYEWIGELGNPFLVEENWKALYATWLDAQPDRLKRIQAETRRFALLCAEKAPEDCHRLLVANALAGEGWTISHL